MVLVIRYWYKLGIAYNEFGYNEHPAITSRILCIKITDCNVKKLAYNEHPLITNNFFCIFNSLEAGPVVYKLRVSSFIHFSSKNCPIFSNYYQMLLLLCFKIKLKW